MQLYGVVGSSLAARAIGRTSLAELILTERAPPQRVARLFAMSASKNSGRDLAFILLSGAHARCRARPDGWRNDVEHELARAALARQTNDDVEKVIRELSAQADQTVMEGWAEIERLATEIVVSNIFRRAGASAPSVSLDAARRTPSPKVRNDADCARGLSKTPATLTASATNPR
jgi:hypothetical protein